MNWLNKCHFGDCLETLRRMPDGIAQTCVTSPPYFGLRDYQGGAAEIGKEKTPDEFVAALVAVFREVRRVLRDDGTLWLNIGDSYAAAGGAQVQGTKQAKGSQDGAWGGQTRKPPPGVKAKDLIGIPWLLAFALRADGWYLRQDIIWHKPNCMPQRVSDRCTSSHEHIFLLSKQSSYFFDAQAMSEPAENGGKRNRRDVWQINTRAFKGAHFATFPPDLIEPCILAGTPVGGVVLDCFFGSGTTGNVAQKHGRKFIGCELNPANKALQDERLHQPSLYLEAA